MRPLAAVVGYGRTAFGESWDKNFEELLMEAGIRTFRSVDEGLSRAQVEACYFGGSLPQAISKTGLVEAYMSRELGLMSPITMVGGGSASGSSALHEACGQIRGGSEIVLVGGIEKMSDRVKKIQDDLMFDADRSEFYSGFTSAGLVAAMMARYIYEFGGGDRVLCREAFARVASKNHHHAVHNEFAQFRRDLSVEAVLRSSLVADPLRGLECSPISDGAASLILVPPERAGEFTDTPIYIVASEKVTDSIDLGCRESMTGVPATELCVRKALERAGLSIGEVDIGEVHDSYSPHEVFFLEDSGFAERGRGWEVVSDVDGFGSEKHLAYENAAGERLTVNVGGGLKADGNPLGATGVRQVCEVVSQRRGAAGDNQVGGDVNVGLAHNLGGTGGICNVQILVRDLG